MRFLSLHPTVAGKNTTPANLFETAFDDFFRSGFPAALRQEFSAKTPAVNITETPDAFKLEVAAPGLSKEDFEVKLDHEMLTISAKKDSKSAEGEKVTRREFSFFEFKRSFLLPDSVDTQGISANYENGILHLTLAKKAEAKPLPARTIEVA